MTERERLCSELNRTRASYLNADRARRRWARRARERKADAQTAAARLAAYDRDHGGKDD